MRRATISVGSVVLIAATLSLQVATSKPAGAQGGTSTWTQASPETVPPGFINPSMAFDASSGQLVLVGATSSDTTEETWLWDGTNWQQVFPDDSPPAAVSASVAYDPDNNGVVFFGGQAWSNNAFLAETWVWDGSNWSNVTPGGTSPPGRVQASLTYDPSSDQMILFGGLGGTGSTQFDDTWNWTGSAWNQLSPGTVPPERYSASSAYDPVSQQIIMFGGSGYADTWGWTGSNWDQLGPMNSPGSSYGAALAYDGDTGTLIYNGGQATEGYLRNGTFNWDGGDWNPLSPANSPEALGFQAVAYDPDTSQLVTFGGLNENSDYTSDTWIYAPAAPSSTCTPFSDQFQSGALSSDWQTDTPLVASVASDLGYTDEEPQLNFSEAGMDMQGAADNNEFTGIQSVTACSGPLSFEADVEPLESNGGPFVIDLVSADQSQVLSVVGYANSEEAGAPYGIFAYPNNGTPNEILRDARDQRDL